MNDFEKLDMPKKSRLGWYVVSMVNGVHYLHDDSRIHVGTQDSFSSSTGYFSKESNAYDYAQRYYKYHGMKYPYSLPTEGSRKVNDGSQKMIFV